MYSKIYVGDGEKQHTDQDSDDSSQTVGYILSNEDDSDESDDSDNEPLSKKVMKRSDSPDFENEQPSDSSKHVK